MHITATFLCISLHIFPLLYSSHITLNTHNDCVSVIFWLIKTVLLVNEDILYLLSPSSVGTAKLRKKEQVANETQVRKKVPDSAEQTMESSFYSFFYLFWNFLEIL